MSWFTRSILLKNDLYSIQMAMDQRRPVWSKSPFFSSFFLFKKLLKSGCLNRLMGFSFYCFPVQGDQMICSLRQLLIWTRYPFSHLSTMVWLYRIDRFCYCHSHLYTNHRLSDEMQTSMSSFSKIAAYRRGKRSWAHH